MVAPHGINGPDSGAVFIVFMSRRAKKKARRRALVAGLVQTFCKQWKPNPFASERSNRVGDGGITSGTPTSPRPPGAHCFATKVMSIEFLAHAQHGVGVKLRCSG